MFTSHRWILIRFFFFKFSPVIFLFEVPITFSFLQMLVFPFLEVIWKSWTPRIEFSEHVPGKVSRLLNTLTVPESFSVWKISDIFSVPNWTSRRKLPDQSTFPLYLHLSKSRRKLRNEPKNKQERKQLIPTLKSASQTLFNSPVVAVNVTRDQRSVSQRLKY